MPTLTLSHKYCPRCSTTRAACHFYVSGGKLSGYCRSCYGSYQQSYAQTKQTTAAPLLYLIDGRLAANRKLLTKLFRKVRVSLISSYKGDPCWEWTGCLTKGYGRVAIDGKIRNTHNLTYRLFVGEVPSGFELDHLCRNKRCLNPYHLEAVTHVENVRRGYQFKYRSLPGYCKGGHLLSDDNILPYELPARVCRLCKQRRYRTARAKKRSLKVGS
jgi:hypothetical protein